MIGTFLGDFFMWYSLKIASHKNLPLAVAIIHTAPILSLLFVFLIYKEKIDYRAIFGIILSIIGCIIAIIYSGSNVKYL